MRFEWFWLLQLMDLHLKLAAVFVCTYMWLPFACFQACVCVSVRARENT